MPNDTTKCENCDAVIAKDEKKCPACGIVFDELEQQLKDYETLEKIRNKRNKKNEPTPEPKKRGLFGNIRK